MPLAEEWIWISDLSLQKAVWNLLLQPNIWCGLRCHHYIFSSLMFWYLQSEVAGFKCLKSGMKVSVGEWNVYVKCNMLLETGHTCYKHLALFFFVELLTRYKLINNCVNSNCFFLLIIIVNFI
ncbi:hypothetical protein CFOL_v3_08990 [Cephalotus follicularis]|uniref:Uncharacterized protein n=1 Tax=Cephalotus follicularis TaxID=3775 RepID=A0A1Q3BC59_CEPFO|nr:hypothetical protein CFOL_v3_08990 [Cephalotus follicularis]